LSKSCHRESSLNLRVRAKLSLDRRSAGANNIDLAGRRKRLYGIENDRSITASRMTEVLNFIQDQYSRVMRGEQSTDDAGAIYTPTVKNGGSVK
jgi:hypothetical protein